MAKQPFLFNNFPDELKEMILGVRRIEQILGTKEKKVTEVELFKKNGTLSLDIYL